MENKAHALMAGIFTIALLIAAVLIAMWLNRDRVERVPYEMATKLSIPGLNPQAAVRYRGLDVGKVDAITFDPAVPGQILVQIGVRPDTPITKSTFGTLAYQGVTGIAYVQLDDDGTNPVKVSSAKDHIARIEMRPSLLDNLQDRGLAILIQTEEIAKRINTLLSPDNQKAMLQAFDNVSKAATEIEAIPRQLQPTLTRLPMLTAEMQSTMASISRLSQNASALTSTLNGATTQLVAPDGPVAKLSSTVDLLGAEATPLIHDARQSLRTLNHTLDNFNNRPQSILFGATGIAPGPGETGFVAPSK
ncbi:MAG TPA: MlaD family protein [Paucimonas sp.]|nr:MlaD family protein [Paucimonas sp.]HJW54381.1 MlaD family protein [Burkholderiaceae bacterium]